MTDETPVVALFDPDWYAATYADVAGQDPLEHFITRGAAAGRNPNPLFDTAWYLRRYPDVVASGLTAFDDFRIRGTELLRDPGPLFSTKWYLASSPDVAEAEVNPLAHYLRWGRAELRDPSPVFDSAWYFKTYPYAALSDTDACTHYIRHGMILGCAPCALFDPAWYVNSYPDAITRSCDPLLHYLTKGAALGYDPGPHFSTSEYLEKHPGLAASGENPLVHYLARHRDRAAKKTSTTFASRVTGEALEEARAVIRALSQIEPELVALSEDLEILPVRPHGPPSSASTWRRLYLSIYEVPTHLLLVGSIDDVAELGELAENIPGLLIVETDSECVSTAELVPDWISWRSLSEFNAELDFDDRVQVVTALVNSFQPQALLVWGSRAGWEVLARYGAALGRSTALFAAAAPSSDDTVTDLLRRYFRRSIKALSAIYSPDVQDLKRSAAVFGLPPADYIKLRDMRTWRDTDGFLGVGTGQP